MRYQILCLLIIALIAACGPSPEQIALETSVAETSTASSWTATPASTPTLTATQTPQFKGLGVSRSKIQLALENQGIQFEPSFVENGVESVVGHYVQNERGSEIVVFYMLTGPEDDLLEASVSVGVPLIPPKNSSENINTYLKSFLELIIPDRVDSREWIETNIYTLADTPTLYTSLDNFQVSLEFIVFNDPNVRAINHTLTIGTDLPKPTSNVVQSASTSEPDWIEHHGLGVSLRYPAEWTMKDVADNPGCYQKVDCLLAITSPNRNAHISVLRTVLELDANTEEFEQAFWKLREQSFAKIGLSNQPRLESREEIIIDERTAVMRVFSEPDILEKELQNTVYVVNVCLVDGPYTYTFLLSADSKDVRDAYLAEFKEMLKSIQIAPSL